MTSAKHEPGGAHETDGATLPVERVAAEIKGLVERRLAELLASGPDQGRLGPAMRYSALAAAKRVRAIILVLSAGQGDARRGGALASAAAIEMVHAASLILDDLPSMDDATLRRGRKATHLAFGEDIAILSAVGLITRAFEVVAGDPLLPAPLRVRVAAILAEALGPAGLVRGQELDLTRVAPPAGVEEIESMHALKTGALFAAATEIGANLAGLDPGATASLRDVGRDIGIAFQAYDDLLDAVASTAAVGKNVRRDSTKATVVASLGIAEAERRAHARIESVRRRLAALGPAGHALAGYLDVLVRTLAQPLTSGGEPLRPVRPRPV